MNLPNKLTTSRMLLAIPFIYFLEAAPVKGDIYRYIAFVLFVIASLTDWLDGYLARKHNLITDFGKLMDPLADRILVISAMVIFVGNGWIPSWMSVVVIAREFLIGGIRTLAAASGEVIPAGNLGKYKTTSQMIVIILILLFQPSKEYNFYLMLIPVILTIWSGWEYTKAAKHYFLNQN